MMVDVEFVCCEIEQTAQTQATGTVERLDFVCRVCHQSTEVEVDTQDYN